MLERPDYYKPSFNIGTMPMGMGIMPMAGGSYAYGMNRDALTLRGPLAYDQYGDTADRNQKKKDSGFWKGLVGTAIAVGTGLLAWKSPVIKTALTKAGTYVVDLVKKFLK